MSADEPFEAAALRILIKRLEPEVGRRITPAYFAAWEGNEEALQSRLKGGKGHFAQAVKMAREALQSRDQQKMAQAAIICAGLERKGRTIEAKLQRQTGGTKRGEEQTAAAKAWWAPWIAVFLAMVRAGQSPANARAKIHSRMVNEAADRKFVWPPGAKRVPSRRTIGDWLK